MRQSLLDNVSIRDYIMSMGIRLKEIRNRKGLSIRSLATICGIGFATVYRIEAGKVAPKFDTLEKLAKALGVSVRDLIEK